MAWVGELPLVMLERGTLLGTPMSMLECRLLDDEPRAGSCLYAGCTAGRAPLVIGFPWTTLSGEVYCVSDLSQVLPNILVLERGEPLDETRLRAAMAEKVFLLPWVAEAREALRDATSKRTARRWRTGRAHCPAAMD